MSYQNTGKPNGRPPNTDRNNSIIAEFNAGIPAKEIAENHGLGKQYVQKIFTDHKAKQKLLELSDKSSVRLFAERDMEMKKFYKSLNTKGALSKLHIQDMGKINSGYTRRAV